MRALVLFLCAAVAAAQTPIAIVGATVVDGSGGEPRTATVVIRGERIEAVGSDAAIPAGARVIRAEGHTLLPGLFDVHTHLPYSAVQGLNGDWGKTLKAYLYCGVTTAVDFGSYPEMFEPMRRLIREGIVIGPRLLLAPRITTPGGHGAEGGRGDFFSLEVLTPREGRAAIRRVLPYKPDAIKVFTDGWRYGSAADMTSMDEQTLAAIVDEAHKTNLPVLTHTVTLGKAKIAARAGVNVIAHGVGDAPVDEQLIEIMKSKGTTYAPTLSVYEPRGRRPPPTMALFEPLARQLLEPAASGGPAGGGTTPRWRTLLANTAALRAAGIPHAAGTDAGVTGTYHGASTLRELKLLVEGGLTPLEAITAATANAARALHADGERGFIAAGKLADLVLVEGAPYRDIADMDRMRSVFLGGKELDRDGLARDIGSAEQTPVPSRKAAARIDDMEREDRTLLDTLRVNSTDAGNDNTHMLFGRILRAPGNHALSVSSRMAEKDRPFAEVNLPLSPGAIEPVDASAFQGVQFDARGEGEYRLVVVTRTVRDTGRYAAGFQAGAKWRRVRVPFASLSRPESKWPAAWTARDLLMLSFEASRKAAEYAWLELDNVRFY